MKLFMFYVGGKFKNANVELHDVRFSVGESAEACYPDLRRQWWGDPKSLHLDCWGAVTYADGFEVSVAATENRSLKQRLYFANMGGYDPRVFEELHHNMLLVAADPATAKKRALEKVRRWAMPHRDNLFEVENLLDINKEVVADGHHLRLKKSEKKLEFEFNFGYLPIALRNK